MTVVLPPSPTNGMNDSTATDNDSGLAALGLAVADGGDGNSVSSIRARSPSTFAELPGGTLLPAHEDRRLATRILIRRLQSMAPSDAVA